MAVDHLNDLVWLGHMTFSAKPIHLRKKLPLPHDRISLR
jgi:hypothetical protein